MPAPVVAGMRGALNPPIGPALFQNDPELRSIQGLSEGSPAQLRTFGPPAAELPASSVPKALIEIDERARAAVGFVTSGELDGSGAAGRAIKSGDDAREMAAVLLRGLTKDDGAAGSPGERAAGSDAGPPPLRAHEAARIGARASQIPTPAKAAPLAGWGRKVRSSFLIRLMGRTFRGLAAWMEDGELPVRLLHPDAILPTRGHPDDAGLDLYAVEDTLIPPGEKRVVRTGVAIAIPPGYVGMINERSSSARRGLMTLGNVIDAGYVGEISGIVQNLSSEPKLIKRGERFVQIVVMPIKSFTPVQRADLGQTARGTGGFGSTGR